MKENILIFIDFIKKLYKNRYMIRTMAVRDLKEHYVGRLFGSLWAVLQPLSLVAVYGIVFGIFMQHKPDAVYRTDSYFLFLLCGLIPWQLFSQTLSSSTTVIVTNANLVKKAVGFPLEILQIVKIISNIISYLISMVLLLILTVVINGYISPAVFVVVFYTICVILFTVGFGWIISSTYVYLRDLQQVMGVIIMMWFFFTPIFYSPSVVPVEFSTLLWFNPMFYVVEGYRYALLAGEIRPWSDFVYLFIISFVTFAVGGVFFRKLKPGFAEVL